MDDLHAILEVLENADIPEGDYLRMTKTLKDLYAKLPKKSESPRVHYVPYGSLSIGHSVMNIETYNQPESEIRMMEEHIQALQDAISANEVNIEHAQARIQMLRDVHVDRRQAWSHYDENHIDYKLNTLDIQLCDYNIKQMETSIERHRMSILKITNTLLEIRARIAS